MLTYAMDFVLLTLTISVLDLRNNLNLIVILTMNCCFYDAVSIRISKNLDSKQGFYPD